jgi:hypothetical protein
MKPSIPRGEFVVHLRDVQAAAHCRDEFAPKSLLILTLLPATKKWIILAGMAFPLDGLISHC